MRSRFRRHLAVVSVLALVSSLTVVMLGSTVAFAQSNTYDCLNPFDGSHFDIDVDVTGDATGPVVLPGTTTVDNLDLTGTFPGSLVQLGITGGAITYGQALNLNTFIEIEGTNVAEGPVQTAVLTASPIVTYNGGQTSLPAPPGAVADDIVFTISYADSFVFTPQAAGTSDFSVTLVDIVLPALLGFHLACDGVAPITPFQSVTVTAPPAPPVVNDDGPGVGLWGNATVGGGQSVTINILANDSDQNGDLDPTSVVITHPGAGVTGDVVDLGGGNIQYTNLDPNVGTDTFTYTVDDLAGLGPSGPATVEIEVLGAFCTAGTNTSAPLPGATDDIPGCSLDQVLTLPIVGANLSMEQFQTGFNPDANNVILGSCTGTPFVLNGDAQVACGQYNDIVVTNALGTDTDWAITATTTDLTDGTVADCSTPSNHCIPAGNVGMSPFAAGPHPVGPAFGGDYGVIHTVIAGDVAVYTPGSPVYPAPAPGGLADTGAGTGLTLCSADAGHSGGTFRCGASVLIGVPASAAAGVYVGTTTFTLA